MQDNTLHIHIQILLFFSSEDLKNLLEGISSLVPSSKKLSFHFMDQSENDAEYIKVKNLIENIYIKNIKLNIDKQPNYGFGKGHNEIYKKHKREYKNFFIILNPDTFFMYDTISNLTKYLKVVKDSNWGLLEMEQFPNEHPKYYDPKTLETPWGSGSGLVINKKAFESVGMFDENIFMYGEDVDLSITMRKNKYKILHLPRCKFVHLTKDTDVTETSNFTFNHKQAAELYLRYKHAKDSDLKAFEKILKANKRNYKTIMKMFRKMISKPVKRSFLKGFVSKAQDYTKFRWFL